ncbi:MAG: choice-of-anchor S family protein [Candidatus Heimdallarchaeota archaeon]
MKKLLKITLAILFASLFIGMSFAKADFTVTVGTVNTYDVNSAEWDFAVGADSSSGTGYEFEDQKFSEGTQFTVTVDAVTASQVDYTVNVGAKSDTGVANSFALLGIVFLMFYPILFAGGTMGTWNQTEADLGPSLMEIFFLEPEDSNEFFYEMANTTFVSSVFTDTEWTYDSIGGTFENDTDIAIFTWTLNAQYEIVASNTDFSGTYSFVIAYDQTTGEVMGYRIDLDYSGTAEGAVLDIQLLQEVEMLGYNLPAGGLFPSGFIGIELYIAIPALALIGLLGVVVRKRKQ